MSDTILTCSECDELFADWIEGDLAPDSGARVETHVASCARCQGLIRDIDEIRETAANLPDIVPTRDLWQGIEERIQASVVSISPRRNVAAIPRSWLATAAAGLIVVSSSVTYVATSRTMQKESKPKASDASAPVRVSGATVNAEAERVPAATEVPERVPQEASVPRRSAPSVAQRSARPVVREVANRQMLPAEAALSTEIDKLEELLSQRRGQLEPETVRVVEENLAIIDAAVNQARAAVERDPGSGFLSGRLESALNKKVQLLRTVALMRSST
jgi:hypothetical protein